MTDRELLELAARAAGIPLKPDFAQRFDYYMADPLMWNPLQSDGDALRLAVKLTLRVSVNRALGLRAAGSVTVEYPDGGGYYIAIAEAAGSSGPEAATRRAIVRAAAEIGKGQP